MQYAAVLKRWVLKIGFFVQEGYEQRPIVNEDCGCGECLVPLSKGVGEINHDLG